MRRDCDTRLAIGSQVINLPKGFANVLKLSTLIHAVHMHIYPPNATGVSPVFSLY